MKRRCARPALLPIVAVALAAGCIERFEPVSGSLPKQVSCDQCHHYPGVSCKDTAVLVQGATHSQCVACHWDAIQLDSALDPASNHFVYFDASDVIDGEEKPRTGRLHANDRLDTAASPMHCAMCHTVPSPKCQWDSLLPMSKSFAGNCFACHAGAVQKDSALVATYIQRPSNTLVTTRRAAWLVHDEFSFNGADTFSLIDSLHRNGQADFRMESVQLGRCNSCHDYKPMAGLHSLHVSRNSSGDIRQCIECHFQTVAYDSAIDSTQFGPRVRYGQTVFLTPDGDTLPLVNTAHHMNGAKDVSFYNRFINAATPGHDTMFAWNAAEKSCSNVDCHGGGDPSSSLYKKTYWK